MRNFNVILFEERGRRAWRMPAPAHASLLLTAWAVAASLHAAGYVVQGVQEGGNDWIRLALVDPDGRPASALIWPGKSPLNPNLR